MEEIVKQLWEAAESKRVCRITLEKEPFPRVVHPYGVFRSSANKIVFICWQEAGFTKAGRTAGYRNLFLEKVQEVEILDKRFFKRDDFNEKDPLYSEWVFHI